MSTIRLNISDAERAINGEVHGSFGEVVVAALTAEPETIDELGQALARFIESLSDSSPFAWLQKGENFEPDDAGVVVIDLAARVVAIDSSYSQPSAEGNVRVEGDLSEDDFLIPYRLSDDWLCVYSITDYEGVRAKRRDERAVSKPLDVREVLYGRGLPEFIAHELFAARDSDDEELFTAIHAKWLMTARADLQGQTPREVLLAKRDSLTLIYIRERCNGLSRAHARCLCRATRTLTLARDSAHTRLLFTTNLFAICWKNVLHGCAPRQSFP